MSTLEENSRFLADKILAAHHDRRLIVGIAGAPGSGKSTLAEELRRELNRRQPGFAAIVPMDGFHYDDAVLCELDLLPRKGAIETFDVDGFVQLLRRLRDNSEEAIAIPVFDRAIEIARAGARLIHKSAAVIIVEGNYLLVKRPVWNRISDLLDIAIMIEAGEETLRRRLTERWRGYGLARQEIKRKLDENDLPNGRIVYGESVPADIRIQA